MTGAWLARACGILISAVIIGCGGSDGSSDGSRSAAPSITPETGSDAYNRTVRGNLRTLVPGARRARAPISINMRDIAPFPWTRFYVFQISSRAEIQRSLLRDLGVRWEGAPADLDTPILVFADESGIRSVSQTNDIGFDCLERDGGWQRAESAFELLRTNADPGSPPAIPATPSSLVATPMRFPSDIESSPCLQVFGVLK